MQAILIFLLSIAAAVFYGIVHDHITARICLEYFTVGHPPIFGGTKDVNLIAFGWGVIATWWVGAILGIPLSAAAQFGSLPKRSAKSLIVPISVLLLCMAVCAALAGIIGYFLASSAAAKGQPMIDLDWTGIPADRQIGFIVDAFSHLASYAVGFLGGILLIAWVLFWRWRADVAKRVQTITRKSVQ